MKRLRIGDLPDLEKARGAWRFGPFLIFKRLKKTAYYLSAKIIFIMARRILFLFILLIAVNKNAFAQYSIGHTTITFLDASRSNRAIQTEIYYPAATTGDNVPCAAGAFEVVNFGHGFVMVWSAYQNIWEALVPDGFIVCFPKTEGSISPNHTAFANDLGFLCTAMTAENALSNSIFFNHVEPNFAVVGHSMGGGCAVLANGFGGGQIKCIATLAAANTNPSAISAAAGVTIPTLTIAGSYDCIAPPAAHQLPIFNALQPDLCKIYVNITGASHCNFANSNGNCTFGQVASGCNAPPISVGVQQSLAASMLKPFLKHYLKDDDDAWIDLTGVLNDGGGFEKKHVCAALALDEKAKNDLFSIELMENPTENGLLRLFLNGNLIGQKVDFEVFDALGRNVFSVSKRRILDGETVELDISALPNGAYFLVSKSENGRRAAQLFLVE